MIGLSAWLVAVRIGVTVPGSPGAESVDHVGGLAVRGDRDGPGAVPDRDRGEGRVGGGPDRGDRVRIGVGDVCGLAIRGDRDGDNGGQAGPMGMGLRAVLVAVRIGTTMPSLSWLVP